MAAIKFIKRVVALDGSNITEQLPASFFNSEASAHTFIIAGVRDGAAVAFTGSVSATFHNANDADVSLTGSVVDGAAVVTLSNACYVLSGRFTLTIDVNGATVYECNSRIKRRSSGTAYDPDDELTVAALSAEIAAMRTTTAAANEAVQNANTAIANANTAIANTNTAIANANTAANNANDAVNRMDSTIDETVETQVGVEVDRLDAKKVNKPTVNPNGTAGQILRTNGNGSTTWIDLGLPTDEQTEAAIAAWLNDHPEATTTVPDYSLTNKKLVLGTLGYVTPEMYGAYGDGVTDDTTAINAAIAANSCVLFSAEKYLISDEIILHDNLLLLSGKKSCLFMAGGTASGFVHANGLKDVTIENIEFDINPDGQSARYISVKFTNSEAIKFSGVEIGDQKAYGAYDVDGNCNFTNCHNVILDNCTIHGSCHENLVCVSCYDVHIIGGEYYDARNGSAIVTDGSQFHLYNIYIHDTVGSGISYNSTDGEIIGCTIKNVDLTVTGTNGITIGHARPNSVGDRSVISSNTIENAPHGIGVAASNFVTIENNTIIGAANFQTANGIRCTNASSNITIRGNTVTGCNYGIAPISGTIVDGNTVTGCTVGIAMGHQCTECLIQNNICVDNVTAGIDDIAATASNNKYIGNTCSVVSGSQAYGLRVRSVGCLVLFNTCKGNVTTDLSSPNVNPRMYNRTTNTDTVGYDTTIFTPFQTLFVSGASLKDTLLAQNNTRKSGANQVYFGAFVNLTDNPFPSITSGMFIAMRQMSYSGAFFCLGYNGSTIEVGTVSGS